MRVKKIWDGEYRKRSKSMAQKERANRNWPVHADRAILVFSKFAEEASHDGVAFFITPTNWFLQEKRMGSFPLGESSVMLSSHGAFTGHGTLTRTDEATEVHWDSESGASLVVHHSPAEGLIQVFFQPPKKDNSPRESAGLLYKHTYNTDDLTICWLENIIPPFLRFNRVESSIYRSSWLDRSLVRWWRFKDTRNQRGYLDQFQNLLTPGQLFLVVLIFTAIGNAAVLTIGKALIGLAIG